MGLPRAVTRLAGTFLVGCVLAVACVAAVVRAQGADLPGSAPMSLAVLSQSALAGDPKAQCNLGVALINGDHVPQNFAAGLHWLFLASGQDFGYAHYVLADLYSRGYAGLPVSDEQTYVFASLAAASAGLPESYHLRALKLRTQAARRLSPSRLAAIQASLAGLPCKVAPGP